MELEELGLLPEACCDDCWSEQSVYWSFPDNVKRGLNCFKLHVAIISTPNPDPKRLAEQAELLGVAFRREKSGGLPNMQERS